MQDWKNMTPVGWGCRAMLGECRENSKAGIPATARKKPAQPLIAIRDAFCPSKQGEGRWTWSFLFVADAYRAGAVIDVNAMHGKAAAPLLP